MRAPGLLLFSRRHQDPGEHRAVPGTPDDHDHVQRSRERGQHRPVRGDLQRAAAKSQRLPDQRNLLRLSQVHQLLGGPRSPSSWPRDSRVLPHPQGRSTILDPGQLRRLAGGDGGRETNYRTFRQHYRRFHHWDEGPLPAGGR